MSEAFEHFADKFDELYEVEKVAVVIHNNQRYRFEALRCYTNPKTPYVVHHYREEVVDGKSTWVDTSRPWVVMDSADSAIASALSFLHQDMNLSK